MISAANIFIKYGDRVLLDSINLVIGAKDRIGLVGRNGAGKSTLMKIIANYTKPHEGQVDYPNGASIGYLHQEMDLPKGKTVMEETLSCFSEVKALERQIEATNEALSSRTDYESESYMKLIADIGDLNERFSFLGGDSIQADSERVLKGLGFKQKDLNRLTDEFSGGWQMRIELAKMLLQKPDYLLLDEPTNHLDIESIIWLENFLKNYHACVIVISHDKQFLDHVTTRTVEIELGKLFDYKASYSKFVAMRAERREMQMASYKNQQKVIAQKERVITRFMAKATKTKMAQSMKKQLDKMERITIDSEDTAAMNISFPPAPRSGVQVVLAEKILKKYGDLQVLNQIDLNVDRADRIAFVGQNGQGKTTLAKIIVNEIAATSGEVKLGHNVQIGYYAQNQSETLQSNLTLLETLERVAPPEMRTRLRNILGAFLFSGEDVDKKVSVLSGGERARLALACLLLRPSNLLVLDEPTNHLDMISKDVLKQALLDYDGTLIVVSHDRDFLKELTTRTVEFRDQQLFNHIGDVNAFLEKRALDSMREVELSKPKTTSPLSTTPNSGVAPKRHLTKEEQKERKRLQRAVQNAERKIERIESEIEAFETQMASPGFYEKPDAAAQMEQYAQKKKDLEGAMEEWENAEMTLEEFEG